MNQQRGYGPSIVLAVVTLVLCWPAGESGLRAETSKSDRPNVIVIFADDLGYADVGAQGELDDVRTPSLDRLAQDGARCTAGYVTAPQCSPSRAGLITGRYQQRFGLDTIPDCPLPLDEVTLAERLNSAGYTCGMIGKWHLEPNGLSREWARTHLPVVKPTQQGRVAIPPERAVEYFPHRQGFQEYFVGPMRRYYSNVGPRGDEVHAEGEWINDDRFRVDVQSDAAVAFVQRHAEQPFFLYLCYYAPHVPLEAPAEYLERFPGQMPERRRYALAMMSAVDDGVGRILDTLQEARIDENTLIIFTSDNGAPLKLTREDVPISEQGVWDGSRNDPWVGEKGMLSEGGIRVPFLLQWKGTIPAGTVYSEPVSTLDIAATAIAAGGQPADPQLDGVDLVPFLTGRNSDAPHDALYWRFWNQAAVRVGNWKYLRLSDQAEYLFDLASEEHETRNVLEANQDVADQLRERLRTWTEELKPPGLPASPPNVQEQRWYEYYFDLPPSPERRPRANRNRNS